jgi:TRAP-type mannitol/chloroaromatic compound transport system substrate-binding protein
MIESVSQQVNVDTLLRYDNANPIALQKLVEEDGVQLRTFSNEILEGAWNASQEYMEEQAALSSDFATVAASFTEFRNRSFPYFNGNEMAYARFALSKIQSAMMMSG